MSQNREKFATQVNSEILSAVRSLADKEGRQLQALVDEALKNRKVTEAGAAALRSAYKFARAANRL